MDDLAGSRGRAEAEPGAIARNHSGGRVAMNKLQHALADSGAEPRSVLERWSAGDLLKTKRTRSHQIGRVLIGLVGLVVLLGLLGAVYVPMKDIEESIKEFAALGIEVMFTELDLSVLPNPWDKTTADVSATAQGSARMNPYTNGLPDSAQQILAKSYADLFTLFMKYKKDISRVTFWGVNDGQSWLNGFPIRGRTNYPLLFDRNFKPKPAFYSVLATAKNK